MSVDERNNLLIVAAEESLFQEVKALVEQLDFVRLGLHQCGRHRAHLLPDALAGAEHRAGDRHAKATAAGAERGGRRLRVELYHSDSIDLRAEVIGYRWPHILPAEDITIGNVEGLVCCTSIRRHPNASP